MITTKLLKINKAKIAYLVDFYALWMKMSESHSEKYKYKGLLLLVLGILSVVR